MVISSYGKPYRYLVYLVQATQLITTTPPGARRQRSWSVSCACQRLAPQYETTGLLHKAVQIGDPLNFQKKIHGTMPHISL
jgi:hypothetical protein